MTATAEQSRVDPYPTRSAGTASVQPRQDKVVWGSAESGPMDAATLAGFEEKGYLNIEELISPEEVRRTRRSWIGSPRTPQSARTTAASSKPEPGSRSIFEVHKISEVFAKIANDPRVVDRAKQLLGSDVYIHQSRVNFKPGFEGKEFMWHSDFETWHAEDGLPRMRTVTISISLTDNFSTTGR